MPWVAAAGAVVGSLISSDASGDAADAQTDASNRATDAQERQYYQTREDQAPWRQAGERSLQQLNALLMPGGEFSKSFAATGLDNDAGFQFAQQQGMRAIDNSASARGGIGGAALKSGVRFAQGNANQFYNDAFNRFNTERTNRINPLLSMAGLGQQSVAQVGNAGMNFANQAGANMIGAGNAQAANSLNQGNIYGNAFNQLGAYGQRQYGGGGGGGGYNSGYGGLDQGGSPDGYW